MTVIIVCISWLINMTDTEFLFILDIILNLLQQSTGVF
jgi:hypothetical protein